jgi:hypothetical protein
MWFVDKKLQEASVDIISIFNAGMQIWNAIQALGKIFGQVTSVRRWVNNTNQDVNVYKYDHGDPNTRKDDFVIPAGQAVDADMWISWCDSAIEFPGRHCVFELGGAPFAYVWQSGSLIFYSHTDYYTRLPVPGFSPARGDRNVVFDDVAGNYGFAFTGH